MTENSGWPEKKTVIRRCPPTAVRFRIDRPTGPLSREETPATEGVDAMSRDILDFAIVGAGVSGFYCGYRLLTADPTLPALRIAQGVRTRHAVRRRV